jgi:amidase
MAQTVAQTALLLDVLTERDFYSKAATPNEALRIGVVKQWISDNSEVASIFEQAVKKLEGKGVQLIEVELTPPEESDQEDELRVLLYELSEGLQKYLKNRPGSRALTLRDVVNFNLENADKELQYFKQELFDLTLEFESQKKEYEDSRARNLAWANKTLDAGLASVDVLIGCTYGPSWVSSVENGDSYEGATWITCAPAIAGTPIGTIPMGIVSGLPVGLGFVSARNQESKLISAMASAERALNLGVLRPTFSK